MSELVNPKSIVVRRIDSQSARKICVSYHYSKKYVNNSSLNFGCFYNGILHGVIMLGPPLDKRKVIGLVKNTNWNDMIEINRIAFDDFLPKNSESRCLAIVIRLIKKYALNIRWILSFADAGLCGDGAIYRACGFVLAGYKKTESMLKLKDGTYLHKLTIQTYPTAKRTYLGGKSYYELTNGRYVNIDQIAKLLGAEKIEGYQFKYIYLIDKSCELNFTPLSYDIIDKLGAGMYKGKQVSRKERNVRQ